MKTLRSLLLVTLIGLALPLGALAQANVNFSNSSRHPLRLTDGIMSPAGQILSGGSITQILGTASTATFGIGPASVRVELLAGTTANNLFPLLIGNNESLPFVTNTANATILGAQGSFPGGTTVALPTLPGFDGSAPVFFQFRAWSIGGDNALSLAERLNSGSGYAGISDIIAVTPALLPAIPTPLFGDNPNQWQGLTLYAVPEPATLTLIGLGLLLGFQSRRR
jgi:hypothetical protein